MDAILKPFIIGCASKNSKIISISIGTIQRLMSHHAVPTVQDHLSQSFH